MGDHADIDHTGLAGVGGSVATDAIWDAAGDLVVGTGANTAAKLAIGTNGYILTSNGTTAGWAAPGGTVKYSPDNAPGSGLTLSDEFDDSSLDGAWAWTTSPGGTVSESAYPGYLHIEGGTDASATQRFLKRAFTPGAAAFSVAAKVGVSMSEGNFAAGIGIALLDAGDAVVYEARLFTDGTTTGAKAHRILTTAATWGPYAAPVVENGMYLLITRSAANVYSVYYSGATNGLAWQRIGGTTVATAVTQVAVSYASDTDSLEEAGWIDFIRVFNTETKKIGA